MSLIRRPTFHRATKVLHCSVEGEENSIEVFTDDGWLVIWINKAEVIHCNYQVRSEGFRWHPARRREDA